MTGEMHWVNQDGTDSNGDVWKIHAAVAKAVGGRLMPFDVYQGPYIVVGPDLRVGRTPVNARHLGIVRLWLYVKDDLVGVVYREDTDTYREYLPIDDADEACNAAYDLLQEEVSLTC